MIHKLQSDCGGWDVTTVCDEIWPQGWKVGNVPKYCACGTATFARPGTYPPGYRSTSSISYPETGKLEFTDFVAAHKRIGAELENCVIALGNT